MTELEQIHILSKSRKIQITEHALKRANERSIDILTDILPALELCEIIEEYPNDYPYKSFLVLGTTLNMGEPDSVDSHSQHATGFRS